MTKVYLFGIEYLSKKTFPLASQRNEGGNMLYRSWAFVFVVALIVLHVSCAKLPQTQSPKEGEVISEKLIETNSIPADWGKLISVVNTTDAAMFQLWFQSEKGDVRMATYSMRFNRLEKLAKLIPQK